MSDKYFTVNIRAYLDKDEPTYNRRGKSLRLTLRFFLSRMTGQAKISPKISAYYSKPSNQEKLAHTIHQNLLPLMSDCNMAIQDIYTLFIQDDSISDVKKKNLTPLYKPASSRLLFLAKPSSLHITCYP